MEETCSLQEQKVLAEKMFEAFGDELNAISLEFQEIIIDDLAKTFQNRIEMFAKIQSKQNH